MIISKEPLREECGVLGIYNSGDLDTSYIAYNMLHALQHRGQDGAGLAASTGAEVYLEKNVGLVNDVFDRTNLPMFANRPFVIGHVRYTALTSARSVLDTQPLVMYGRDGFMALGHNGRLVNSDELRSQLQSQGHLLQTCSDAEILLHLIAQGLAKTADLIAAIRYMTDRVRGSYAMVLMVPDRIIGVRDPWGIRPLSIGRTGDNYFLVSESCSLNIIQAELVREVEPGEIVVLDRSGLHTYPSPTPLPQKHACVFEYVYFARPDTVMDGISVYSARYRTGQALAKMMPVDADIVAGVPASAIPAAMGYAQASGIPFAQALLKSPYTGRTFIERGQKRRERTVRLKLSPVRSQIEGKRIVLVDDSIVRGTNSLLIVNLLRQAGAKEVHMRIASPSVRFPCHFGINTPSADHLIGARHTAEEIRELINADSLAYLHEEALCQAVLGTPFDQEAYPYGPPYGTPHGTCGPFCMACFNGSYPVR